MRFGEAAPSVCCVPVLFFLHSDASDPPLTKLTGFIQCDVRTSQSRAQSVTLKLTWGTSEGGCWIGGAVAVAVFLFFLILFFFISACFHYACWLVVNPLTLAAHAGVLISTPDVKYFGTTLKTQGVKMLISWRLIGSTVFETREDALIGYKWHLWTIYLQLHHP